MTDHAGRRAPAPRPRRRPALRVVAGVPAATAAAMAAHPSSGVGVRRSAGAQTVPGSIPWGRVDPADDERSGEAGCVLLAEARPGDVVKVEALAEDPLAPARAVLYLPVRTDGAVFSVTGPVPGEGDTDGTPPGPLRLTVCRPGSGLAPSVAFRHAFAETGERWVALGTPDADAQDDADGATCRQASTLRRAMATALDFLEHDRGMDRAIARAYLAATAGFVTCPAGDGPASVHVVLEKADFA